MDFSGGGAAVREAAAGGWDTGRRDSPSRHLSISDL
jgi:hypothetical protein